MAENLLKTGYASAASVLQHTLVVADPDFNRGRRRQECRNIFFASICHLRAYIDLKAGNK